MRKAVFILLFCMTAYSSFAQTEGKHIKLENFKSEFVKERHVEIWLPPQYFTNPQQRFPVLYMHDGQNVFSTETAMGNTPWAVDKVAAKLISEGKIEPMIIVASWCTEFRYFEYIPEKAMKYLSPEAKTQLEETWDKIGLTRYDYLADEYLKFMVNELKPYIDKYYRTRPERENTSVCGSSMGGLISMYAISEYPNVFGQAACVSTHWPLLFDNTYMGPSEAIREYMKKSLPSPKKHRIYFDYGTATLDQHYEVHQKMVDSIMRDKGYTEGRNWVTRKFEGAEHNEKAWQARMDVILDFLYEK